MRVRDTRGDGEGEWGAEVLTAQFHLQRERREGIQRIDKACLPCSFCATFCRRITDHQRTRTRILHRPTPTSNRFTEFSYHCAKTVSVGDEFKMCHSKIPMLHCRPRIRSTVNSHQFAPNLFLEFGIGNH